MTWTTLTRSAPLQRTPLARGGPPERGKPMRRVSKKRAALNRVRREVTVPAVRARSGGKCEVPGCRRRARDVHEILKRSRGGSITDVANTLHLCDVHHDFTELEPEAATALGLLRPRTREEHGATGQPRREATR